jgi:peptide-methionine (R)-S-oxide reductase
MHRRGFIGTLMGSAAAFAVAAPAFGYEVEKSDAEWKKQLSPAAYRTLRHQETEAPFTSPLNNEHRKGVFACAGCALDLYSSSTKFDSGTGWPSFWKPLNNAVATSRDTSDFMVRTEVHCRRCGGHLGHVFDDGPAPTGLRY